MASPSLSWSPLDELRHQRPVVLVRRPVDAQPARRERRDRPPPLRLQQRLRQRVEVRGHEVPVQAVHRQEQRLAALRPQARARPRSSARSRTPTPPPPRGPRSSSGSRPRRRRPRIAARVPAPSSPHLQRRRAPVPERKLARMSSTSASKSPASSGLSATSTALPASPCPESSHARSFETSASASSSVVAGSRPIARSGKRVLPVHRRERRVRHRPQVARLRPQRRQRRRPRRRQEALRVVRRVPEEKHVARRGTAPRVVRVREEVPDRLRRGLAVPELRRDLLEGHRPRREPLALPPREERLRRLQELPRADHEVVRLVLGLPQRRERQPLDPRREQPLAGNDQVPVPRLGLEPHRPGPPRTRSPTSPRRAGDSCRASRSSSEEPRSASRPAMESWQARRGQRHVSTTGERDSPATSTVPPSPHPPSNTPPRATCACG